MPRFPRKQEFWDWLHGRGARSHRLPLTSANVAAAREFLRLKWGERARGLGRPDPTDLGGACKFASLFAQSLFGGSVLGNRDHQYLEVSGQILDLTDQTHLSHRHSERWFGNPDHRESLSSCEGRVDGWVQEFLVWLPGWYERNGVEG